MDANSKQSSSEKPQSKAPGGAMSHSSHPRQSNPKRNSSSRRKKSKDRGRNGNQGGGTNERRPPQKLSYRSKHHHSNARYNPEAYNRNGNYNPNRTYNPDWSRNTRPIRNPRWNNAAPRYGNLSWQRKDLNNSQPTRRSEHSTEQRRYINQDYPSSEFHDDISFLDNSPINRNEDPSELKSENLWEDTKHQNLQPQDNSKLASHCFKKRRTLSQEETPSQGSIPSLTSTNEILGYREPLTQEITPSHCIIQNPADINEFPYLGIDNTKYTDLEALSQESVFIKTEPEDFLFDIKPELPDDLNFNLANCLNVDTDNASPLISVIPISRLIKSELQDLNRVDIIVPTPSELLIANRTPARRPTLRPNLVQRRKKSINDDSSGSLSENLVQRVANMDKIGIKNVINNSGTKYDAALKIQARKKLREEIRKQLKSMNFTPSENSENSVLVPDEIVDSMNIPAVVLDEIRKAFGIVLVEDMKVIPETEKPSQATSEEIAKSAEGSSKSPDLMSRLKILEETKSHTDRVSPIKAETSMPKKHFKAKSHDVVIIDSSSSSSSSSSSDSDSDTSSTSTDSNTSTTSSYKRRRRKKRILEANVVGNFEKLILPNLTTAQRRRYREKYSKTTKASLLYIYGVCVSRANNNTVDPKEKLKLKRNLSSADNAQALEFLMKAILNLFEHQKEKRRKDKEKPAESQSQTGSKSKPSNPISPSKKLNDSTYNQGISDDEQRREQHENAISARSCELPKHQSTKVNDAPPPPPLPGEVGVNKYDGDSITESANSAEGVRLAAQDSESDSELDDLTSGGNPPSRQWKSPGEKKCIENETPAPLSSLGMMQPPLGMHSFDLDSLKPQSSIGDEAVSSIREIDVKLMELHKRKMYIEEMILKLQKDKMEVDLWTMKLQNEKFILLNSALANASSSCATLVIPKVEKIAQPSVKRKPFSTPFAEKLRNRKKRCQRDILLEDAGKAINTNTPPSEVSDMSKLLLQPRRTRRDTRRSKVQIEGEQTEAIKTDAGTKAEEDVAEPVKEDLSPLASADVAPVDYTDVPNGNLEGWKLPITQIIVVGEAIIAASEDGNIYKFNIRTRVLESKFSKHTEAITQIFTCPRENFVYTTSLDGFLKKTSIENFGLELQSLNLQEPLQSIDIQWAIAFIGSRWGNIFTYDIKNNNLSESLLCSSGSSIIAIKATKEGPRKILIVSSKGNQINFRDALTGLLLRSLDVPDNLHIYSILLDDGCIFCGTQRNEIHQYNFTTGGRLAVFHCGNGAVSMKLYKEKYIFVGCYDGFVYVLDKTTGCQLGRFPGSGKMILALEIAGDKLITSAKDNTMQIIDIPKYIVTKDKS